MDDAEQPEGAAEALAQSRTGRTRPPRTGDTPPAPQPGEGRDYDISERLTLAQATQLYERRDDEPLYRRLPVFTLDASARQAEGRTTEVKIPYEPLSEGVRGRVITVEARAPGSASLRRAELDHPHVLIAGGYPPSISDPRFHQQMVYAVAMQCYGQFQIALGRQPSWAFDRREDGINRPDPPPVRRDRGRHRPGTTATRARWSSAISSRSRRRPRCRIARAALSSCRFPTT